jgi:hypothetical protein
LKHFYYILLLVLFVCQCRQKEDNSIAQFPGKPEVPSSIKKEHEYLLKRIHRLTLFQDSAGLAALKLYDLMEHHFKEEEDFVLPPLGLLPLLTSGKLPAQTKEVIKLCEKLKSQLSHLSVEHQLINAYLKELKQVAAKENQPGIIEFENELQKHAKTEEEIFFPAAILIGEYLKLKSK